MQDPTTHTIRKLVGFVLWEPPLFHFLNPQACSLVIVAHTTRLPRGHEGCVSLLAVGFVGWEVVGNRFDGSPW